MSTKLTPGLSLSKKSSSGTKKSLENFYVPFVNETSLAIKGSSSYKTIQRKSIVLRVYYVAAAMSGRFEKLMCPALGHNLLLRSVDLLERKSFDRILTVSSKFGTPFNRKAFKYKISDNKINGGKSLLGEYSAEVALYSSKKKRVFSTFYDLANIVKVSLETPKSIRGCSNFKIPKQKDTSMFPLKNVFKF